MHIALGGCLKAPPIRYGLTADTGGHIAYVLGAAAAQCDIAGVERVSIVTRLFDDPLLGRHFAMPVERLSARLSIIRLRGDNDAYLEKDDLADELPALTAALMEMLANDDGRPDVIHAHFADAAAMASAVRERFGIPFVYTPHALGIDKRLSRPFSAGLIRRIAAEHRALADADAIIVSSRDEASRQVAAYGVDAADRVKVIAPGTPAHVTTLAAPRADILAGLDEPAKPIVLAIARPVRKKNLVALVRAYLANAPLMARANLVILAGQHACGRSSEEERAVVIEMRRLAEAEPVLRGRFVMPGSHDADDIAALYSKAADGGVFVNPALHEPFGLTLIEAAAAGVPVVATRNGGAADIVAATGHGLLVDPQDVDAIGAACLAIISDPAMHCRLGDAGRTGSRRYSWDEYAIRSVAVYQSLRAPAPRLLACDIDGTLTGCAAGAKAFGRWRAEPALPFIVATGRSLDAAREVLQTWLLPEPALFVTDVGTRIHRRSDEGWRACADYAAFLDRDWDRDAVVRCLDDLRLVSQAADTAGPHKISFFGSAGDAEAIRVALAEAGLAVRVIFSHGRFIDVLAPRAGKAAALEFVMRERGLTLRHAVACGDSGNDRDMLEAAGHAIVVGNADGDLDDLPPRPGLIRTTAHSASGIMEGLATLGLVVPSLRAAA